MESKMQLMQSSADINNPYIMHALASAEELTIEEFVQVTQYPINLIMFNYFWQVILESRCIHMDTATLEFFGYEGDSRKQKQSFIAMLKHNKINYKELTSKDDLTMYPTIQEEIAQLPHEAAIVRSKWLIMTSRDIKNAIMQLKTKKRRYD